MPLNPGIARQQWLRYTYMRDTGHLLYVAKAQKCEEFFAGLQWDPTDLAALREERRPAITINKVLSTMSSIMGEQIDLRSEIMFKPKSGAPDGMADVLTKTFRYISDQNQLNWVRSNVFADGGITSRGFYDVRMDFSKNQAGDVVITNLNPKNVIPDPDANEYDPDTWNDVMVTKWLTADDIAMLYNAEDAEALRQRSSSTWAYGFDSIDRMRDRFAGTGPIGLYVTEDIKDVARIIRIVERQHKQMAKLTYLVNPKTGDKAQVPHAWDRNQTADMAQKSGLIATDEVGHRIRWTVTADDYVLHDDWSPYKHLTIVPYFPYFRYGRTIGLVENLIDPQELLNKTTSQELHVINTTANSGWKIKKGSLQNMTMDELEQFGSKTGLILELENTDDAEKISANSIPQGLDRLSSKAESYIKSVSSRGDAQMGMSRADVSADALEANNVANELTMRSAIDNLERSDFMLARNVQALVQEFYTDARIMSITHSDLTGEQEEIQINYPDPETGEIMNDVTMGEYTVTVTSQRARRTLEESQFRQAVELRKEGIMIPDEFIIENSNLSNRGAIVKAMKAAAESDIAKFQEQAKVMATKLELANLKAEAAKVEADAILKRAKAAHTVAQTQTEAAGEPGAEQAAEQEQQLALQKHQGGMQMKQQVHEQDLQHQREKHQMEQETRRMEAVEKQRMMRAQAIAASRAKPPAEAGTEPAQAAA